MNVLSTTTRTPRRWARSLTAAMSVSCIIGLVGVSTNSIRVAGVKARSTASGSVVGMNEKARPCRLSTRSMRRNVPP